MNEELKNKVQKILDEEVNDKLALHGGSARLTSIEDGICSVKFEGACASCMSQTDTFDSVVKMKILECVPEVKDVIVDTSVSDDLLDFARQILSGDK